MVPVVPFVSCGPGSSHVLGAAFLRQNWSNHWWSSVVFDRGEGTLGRRTIGSTVDPIVTADGAFPNSVQIEFRRRRPRQRPLVLRREWPLRWLG